MHPKLSIVILGFSLSFTVVAGFSDITQANEFLDADGDRSDGYAIGLWGDLPYSDLQASVGVPNLIADMNRQHLAFTIHDGDLKGGNSTANSVTPTTCHALVPGEPGRHALRREPSLDVGTSHVRHLQYSGVLQQSV